MTESGIVVGDPSATGNVLTNDTDVDTGDSKTVTAVNGSALNVGVLVAGIYGTLTLCANGSWTYALNDADPDTNALAQGQAASDAFTYTVTDANGASSTTALAIAITGANDAPVAVDDANGSDLVIESGVNPGNTPFDGDPSASGNLLTNDTDVDTGDTRTVTAVEGLAPRSARLSQVLSERSSSTPTAPGPIRSTTTMTTPRRWARANRGRIDSLYDHRRQRRQLDGDALYHSPGHQ